MISKKNPKVRNKKIRKFLGLYKITKLLDRNRVEITNNQNENKKEIIHIKELRKSKIVTDLPATSLLQN